MALNDIVFVKGQGGLGRPLEGEDFISGLLLYSGYLPSGFSESSRIKQVFSIAEAEALGIDKQYVDSDAAQSSIELTTGAPIQGYINIKIQEIYSIVDLGKYYLVTGDDDAETLLQNLSTFINNGQIVHGYYSVYSVGSIQLTAPKKLGLFLNGSAPIVNSTYNGTLSAGAFGAGTSSKIAVWHYHISEYFRLQPKGNLFVGIFTTPMGYTFEEIITMQNFAQGKIRQLGIWKDYYWNSGDNTAIQTQINICDGNHKPLSAIIGSDLTDENIANLTDLNTESNNKVSVVIGQDGGGEGWFLFNSYQHSISCLGAVLGATSKASVSTDIAWVNNFNMTNGVELDKLSLGNGQMILDLSQGFLNNLDNKRYIFLNKYVGISGSYVNDSHCAVAVSSDYAYIENNRTIDKAIRGVYASVLPALNSPLLLNSDGTLADTTIAYFTSLAEVNLIQMVRDAELSAEQVTINTTQNVLSTGKIVIAVQLLPVGVARAIQVNIGFVTAIA